MNDILEIQACLFSMLQDIDLVCKKLNIKYYLSSGSVLGAVRHNGFIPWDDDLDIMMFKNDYELFLEKAQSELGNRYFVQKGLEDWPRPFSKVRLNGTTFLEDTIFNPEIHQGVFIDIFPINNLSDNRLVAWLQWKASRMLSIKNIQKSVITKKKRSVKNIFAHGLSMLIPTKTLRKIIELKREPYSKKVQCFCSAASKNKNIFNRDVFGEGIVWLFNNKQFLIPEKYDEYLKTIYNNYLELPPEENRLAEVHAKFFSMTLDYKDYIKGVMK